MINLELTRFVLLNSFYERIKSTYNKIRTQQLYVIGKSKPHYDHVL